MSILEHQLVTKAQKALRGLRTEHGRVALRHGVAATGVHQPLLASLRPATVLDVGANRGQFALDVSAVLPQARIRSFEPMPDAAEVYRLIFADHPLASVQELALGANVGTALLHLSRADDSSSLLPIAAAQVSTFPGTDEVGVQEVQVDTLDSVLKNEELAGPVLLKIDVQGFELEVLRGAVESLAQVTWIYVECSFEEFYEGQPLVGEIVAWLAERGFQLAGLGSVTKTNDRLVQADFVFARSNGF